MHRYLALMFLVSNDRERLRYMVGWLYGWMYGCQLAKMDFVYV